MFKKEAILNLLDEKGWTKYRLAKESGMAQSTLHDILKGKNVNPNTKTLQKIADALGVSINEFFDEEENTEKEINPLTDEEEFLAQLSEDNRLLFKRVKELSSEDAKKVLEIIRIFEKENGQ